MQSTVINFRTNAKTKKIAQQKAKQYGVSLSAILNLLLQRFNSEKTDTKLYNLPEDIELKWLKEDQKTLKNEPKFSSIEELMDDLMTN